MMVTNLSFHVNALTLIVQFWLSVLLAVFGGSMTIAARKSFLLLLSD